MNSKQPSYILNAKSEYILAPLRPNLNLFGTKYKYYQSNDVLIRCDLITKFDRLILDNSFERTLNLIK